MKTRSSLLPAALTSALLLAVALPRDSQPHSAGRAGASSVQEAASASSETRPWASLAARLHSAGEEPRMRLRRKAFDEPLELEYRFDQRLVLESGGAEEQLTNTTDYPLLGVHIRAMATASADGNLRYDLALIEAVHAEEEGMQSAVRRDMQDQIAALKGLRLAWATDARGTSTDGQVRLSGNLSRTDLALVLMDELALDWCLAFPEEPVGIGAEWTCSGDLPVRMVGPDFQSATTLSLRLEKVEDGRAILAVDIQRTPAVANYASADEYASEGVGTMVVDVATGAVVSSSMERSVDARVPVGDTGHSWSLHLETASLVILRDELPPEARTGAVLEDGAESSGR